MEKLATVRRPYLEPVIRKCFIFQLNLQLLYSKLSLLLIFELQMMKIICWLSVKQCCRKFMKWCYFFSGGYYASHSNDSSPTSPSMSGDSLNLQNSGCDCSQVSNLQEVAPTNETSDIPSSESDTNNASNAVSSKE